MSLSDVYNTLQQCSPIDRLQTKIIMLSEILLYSENIFAQKFIESHAGYFGYDGEASFLINDCETLRQIALQPNLIAKMGIQFDGELLVCGFFYDILKPNRLERVKRFSMLLQKHLTCIGYVVKVGYWEDLLIDQSGAVYAGDFSNGVIYLRGKTELEALEYTLNKNNTTSYEPSEVIEFDVSVSGWSKVSQKELDRRQRLLDNIEE